MDSADPLVSLNVIYRHLYGLKDIRILILEPGETHSPVFTRLQVFDLNERPAFEALSYSWDGQIADRSIECNKQPFLVTANVFGALRELRRSDRHRHLWIDQICINQTITNEREKQVKFMAQIYSTAQKILIWLGPAGVDTHVAWDLLRRFKQMSYSIEHFPPAHHIATGAKPDDLSDAQLDRESRPECWSISPTETLPTVDSAQFKPIIDLLSSSWFERAWTFQEIVVGSSDSEVHCGSFVMRWQDFGIACRTIQDCGYEEALAFRSPAKRALAQINLVSAQRTARRMDIPPSRLDFLLKATKHLKASDARDKIYSLLGVMDDEYAGHIKPDYVSPVSETYSATVKSSILVDQNLAILSYVEGTGLRDPTLPTWTPDWRDGSSAYGVSIGMRTLDNSRCFSAAGNSRPKMRDLAEPDKLRLAGFQVAQLRSKLNPCIYDPDVKALPLDCERWEPKFWHKMYRNAVRALNLPIWCARNSELQPNVFNNLWRETVGEDPPSKDDLLETALRRTITADLHPSFGNRLQSDSRRRMFPAYTAWAARHFAREVPPQVLREHDAHVAMAMRSRHLFLAGSDDDAYLCIVSSEARVGDWICVLLGGDAPFVLRMRAQDSQVDAPQEWEFIADCYVHGIMDGEFMEGRAEDSADCEEFVLT